MQLKLAELRECEAELMNRKSELHFLYKKYKVFHKFVGVKQRMHRVLKLLILEPFRWKYCPECSAANGKFSDVKVFAILYRI